MTTEPKPIQTHTFVSLTPDDILTLKLLRDECRAAYSRWPDEKHRRLEDVTLLETLERILKQVG